MKRTAFISLFLIVLCTVSLLYGNNSNNTDTESMLRQARMLFYRSVEDEKYISRAEAAFRKLMDHNKQLQGRAITYLGALTAIKGKHAFWPHDKWDLANEGIELMDKGIAMAPNDVESLFIHGSTCYYLPFFFHRADDAQRKFRKIVQLLPHQEMEYDVEMLHNVVDFIETNAELSEAEQQQISSLRRKLATRRTPEG